MFHKGDLTLLYDYYFKDFKGNIFSPWMGPYEVDIVFYNGIIKLVTIDDTHAYLIVNEHCLRLYHHPDSKDAFIKHVSNKSSLKVASAENSSYESLN